MAQRKHSPMSTYATPQHNTSFTLLWVLAPKATFCSGAASLYQGLLGIFTPAGSAPPQLHLEVDDTQALLSDVSMLLNDAQQAHKRLLRQYPLLTQSLVAF